MPNVCIIYNISVYWNRCTIRRAMLCVLSKTLQTVELYASVNSDTGIQFCRIFTRTGSKRPQSGTVGSASELFGKAVCGIAHIHVCNGVLQNQATIVALPDTDDISLFYFHAGNDLPTP